MIEVAGDVAVLTTPDLAGGVRKTVPDRFSFAIFIPGAFDLIRRTSRAPQKSFWKGHVSHAALLSTATKGAHADRGPSSRRLPPGRPARKSIAVFARGQ